MEGAMGQPLVLRTTLRADLSAGLVINMVECVSRALLYKAHHYLDQSDLGVELIYPMLIAACYAHNALPADTPELGPTPRQLWSQQPPDLSAILTIPGGVVSYQLMDQFCPTKSTGLFVHEAGHVNKVFDLESRSLVFVTEVSLDVSAFSAQIFRSSGLLKGVFGCPDASLLAQLLGRPRLARGRLLLARDAWVTDRAPPLHAGVGACTFGGAPGSAADFSSAFGVANAMSMYPDRWVGSGAAAFSPAAAAADDGRETVN
jgi:hypothetical protein